MKFIIVLLALAALRYLQIMPSAARYHWFTVYAVRIQSWFSGINSAWISMLFILLPILAAVFFIKFALGHWFWGIVGFIINAALLWYCLWPESLDDIIESNYAKTNQGSNIAPGMALQAHQDSRAISEKILMRANENTFSVIFWFFLLGGLGALFYRCVELLRYQAERKQNNLQELLSGIQTLQALLDWIPARITAFSYVLAGDFVAGFSEWSRRAWSGLAENTLILINTGIAAGGFSLTEIDYADREENRSLARLIERALVVWLIALAIYTLGTWIY